MDQMVLDITSEAEIIKNNEDCYDYRQVYLKALLKSTSRGSIREIWRIIPYMTTKTLPHIIILNDGTHLSTSKWLQDNAWENIESLYNEPFISAGGHKSQNTTLQGFIPRHYNNVQEVQKQRENTQLAVIEGHQTSDDIVKLSDGRVYNASDIKDPLAHRGKGRPPTK
ncbi:unnamed protein product [Rhizophagus irregularis]|nr:unnamed protein product [Rhizophagus irregularis]